MRGGPIGVPPFRPVGPCRPRTVQPAAATSDNVPGTRRLRRLSGIADAGWTAASHGHEFRQCRGSSESRPRPLQIGRDVPARWAEDSSLLGPPDHWRPSTVLTNGERHRRSRSSGNAGLSHCGKRIAQSAWPVPMLRAVCVPPVWGRASSLNACPRRDPIDRVAGADDPRESDRQALQRQVGVACQTFRLWDASGARWTGNEVAKGFRARARTVSDVRPCRTVEGFERLASFTGRRSSSAEESLAWPRIRDERTREAHRDLQV